MDGIFSSTCGKLPFRTTAGSIKSASGPWCIEYPSVKAVDCTGSPNQIWVRRNSTDLHLQTVNNKCLGYGLTMDDTVDGRVITNDCKESPNQEWYYDGNRLRPKLNTNRCLSVGSQQTLVISTACAGGSGNEWMEYSAPKQSSSTSLATSLTVSLYACFTILAYILI
jgi:hypothetical protein